MQGKLLKIAIYIKLNLCKSSKTETANFNWLPLELKKYIYQGQKQTNKNFYVRYLYIPCYVFFW